MKGTEIFKDTILNYLQVRANTDEQFAVTFAKEGKSIDNCVNYILRKVKESDCNGFTDEEIYGMAIHYYDEDDIKAEEVAPISVSKVVVNHAPTLTEVAHEAIAEESIPTTATPTATTKTATKQKKQNKNNGQQLTLF